MTEMSVLSNTIAFLLAASFACAAGPQFVVVSSVARARSILVVEIKGVEPPRCPERGPALCEIPARVRVERTLKGNALEPAALTVTLRQALVWVGDRPLSPWTEEDIGPGQRYLLLVDQLGSAQELVESPNEIELLTDAADSVGDVELALRIATLPLNEQAAAIARAVAAGSPPHGAFLAEHIRAILGSGSEAGFDVVAQALVAAPDQAFSEQGRRALLSTLYTARKGPARLGRLLASLTSKYFLIDSRQSRPRLPSDCTLYAIATEPRCGPPALPAGFYHVGLRPAPDRSGLSVGQRAALSEYLPYVWSNQELAGAIPAE